MCLNTVTSSPVDRASVVAARNGLRRAIFVYGCYRKNLTFSVDDVITAFGLERKDRHTVWSWIDELRRRGLVRVLPTTVDRKIQYQIAVSEESNDSNSTSI